MAINIKTDFNDLIDESWRNVFFAPKRMELLPRLKNLYCPISINSRRVIWIFLMHLHIFP